MGSSVWCTAIRLHWQWLRWPCWPGLPWPGCRPRSVTVRPHGLLLLRGSIVPLLMMIGIFTVKYGVAVTQAMHPEVLQATLPALVLGLIYGMFAGRSLGRVLRVLHL